MKPLLLILVILILTCCAPPAPRVNSIDSDGALNVVATTNISADVVAQIGADNIQLTVLLPAGTDPHSYEPTPQDLARVAEADLVFTNGAGLEEFLDALIESAGAANRVVDLSKGIQIHEQEGGQEHTSGDPHVWTDPNNVKSWVENIETALIQADPSHKNVYAANAAAYRSELEDLDTWIRDQVAGIPPENRVILTDHQIFGYFADEYGFSQAGAIVPGYSSLAEPTAQELARIEDTIAEYGVDAIFVGMTVNSSLAERLSKDTGAQIVFLYTGSLSEPGGEAGSYLDYMRFNTNAILDALR